jgi:carbamate kinase
MRVVVALGGNALQKRGEPMTVESQRENVRIASVALAPVAMDHQLVISHGNGPQVGLLSLQAESYDDVSEYPFDVLGAQTEGMIGYFIEQELGNLLPYHKPIATILTMTEVDGNDPAMQDPSKFVGPIYSESDAKRLATEKDWTVKQDGKNWRRVVPSPLPKHIFEIRSIKILLNSGAVVVCTGGGGIPTMFVRSDQIKESEDPAYRGLARAHQLVGVEAVIDKDRSSAVLADDLDADFLVIATDTPAVFLDWGTDDERGIKAASPDQIAEFDFAAGSMGPKVEAACAFARSSPGAHAAIGSLDDLAEIMAGQAGTRINTEVEAMTFHKS